MKALYLSCAALVSVCGLSACSGSTPVPEDPRGTDTGNPFDDDQNEGGENTGGAGLCDEVETELDPSAQTPLGFNGQALLELVAGTHTESLLWSDSNAASFGPEHGRSEITLNVEPLGSTRLVDRSQKTSSGGGEGIAIGEIGGYCNDSLELDVRIQITTSGGALAEEAQATVFATVADFAKAQFSLDASLLAGSFEANPTPPRNTEITKSSLSFTLGFSPYGTVGALGLSSEFRSLGNSGSGATTVGAGSAVGQGGGGEVAHFPADNYCGPSSISLARSEALRGLSLDGVLESLKAASPVPLRTLSGASAGQLTQSYSSTAQSVCAAFDGNYGELPGSVDITFAANVSLESSDGRIDGTLPVQIRATATPDAPNRVFADASVDANDATAAATLPARFGIRDAIDFSGYDGGSVTLASSVAGASPSGSLQVVGLDVADCVTNPPVVDPNGGSSPGCRGTDRIPLWGVLWGNPSQ